MSVIDNAFNAMVAAGLMAFGCMAVLIGGCAAIFDMAWKDEIRGNKQLETMRLYAQNAKNRGENHFGFNFKGKPVSVTLVEQDEHGKFFGTDKYWSLIIHKNFGNEVYNIGRINENGQWDFHFLNARYSITAAKETCAGYNAANRTTVDGAQVLGEIKEILDSAQAVRKKLNSSPVIGQKLNNDIKNGLLVTNNDRSYLAAFRKTGANIRQEKPFVASQMRLRQKVV